jgi:hypothetical protein
MGQAREGKDYAGLPKSLLWLRKLASHGWPGQARTGYSVERASRELIPHQFSSFDSSLEPFANCPELVERQED